MSNKNKVDANPDSGDGGDDEDNMGKSGGAGRGDANPGDDHRETDTTRDAGNTEPGNGGRRQAWYVVDRIEDGHAVLIAEDGGATVDEPVGHLPEEAGEGSCLLRRKDGSLAVDHARTAERRGRARGRLKALRNRSRRKG